jgi:TrbL/VirB6 plasmid conjugal transfer protein
MDSLAYPIFSIVSAVILDGFDSAMNKAYANFVTSITTLALVVELAYVTHYGYLIAFQKSSDAVPVPNLRELAYHAVTVIMVLGILKVDTMALDAIMGLRQMIIGGLTGEFDIPGGQQAAKGMFSMDLAYSVSNIATSTSMTEDAPGLKANTMALSIIADNSPQITAGVMLLLNEITTRTGMALFPLALYTLLYRVTSGFFSSWLEMMLGSAVQMGVLAVVTVLVADATKNFLLALNAVTLITRFFPLGQYFVSELQQSVMEAGFGLLMSMMLSWVPAQASTFSGKFINGSSTKGSLGTEVTLREVELRNVRERTVKPREVKQNNVQPRQVRQNPSPINNNNNPANLPRRP